MSDRDLDVMLEHGVHMNLDLLSQIHRYGRRNRGGTIGIRVNPRVSAARPESGISYYSGDKPTKFGIYPGPSSEGETLDRNPFGHHLLDDDLATRCRARGGGDDERVIAAGVRCARPPRRARGK